MKNQLTSAVNILNENEDSFNISPKVHIELIQTSNYLLVNVAKNIFKELNINNEIKKEIDNIAGAGNRKYQDSNN